MHNWRQNCGQNGRAGWRLLFGWRCVRKHERQRERDNGNRRGKAGATREREKTGDNPP
jgi:hypothetical protein